MHKLHNEGCLNNYRKDKLLESVTEINSATLVLSAISVETTLLIVHGSVWYAFYNIKVKHFTFVAVRGCVLEDTISVASSAMENSHTENTKWLTKAWLTSHTSGKHAYDRGFLCLCSKV